MMTTTLVLSIFPNSFNLSIRELPNLHIDAYVVKVLNEQVNIALTA
jgi:hypothetical protein